MTEQVKVDEVVTNIMYGLSELFEEQERMNQAKAVLYMVLSNMQIYREETALSTSVDNTREWVGLYLAAMVIRGCTERSIEAYKKSINSFLTWSESR